MNLIKSIQYWFVQRKLRNIYYSFEHQVLFLQEYYMAKSKRELIRCINPDEMKKITPSLLHNMILNMANCSLKLRLMSLPSEKYDRIMRGNL